MSEQAVLVIIVSSARTTQVEHSKIESHTFVCMCQIQTDEREMHLPCMCLNYVESRKTGVIFRILVYHHHHHHHHHRRRRRRRQSASWLVVC
jgi:hypothetical protein